MENFEKKPENEVMEITDQEALKHLGINPEAKKRILSDGIVSFMTNEEWEHYQEEQKYNNN